MSANDEFYEVVATTLAALKGLLTALEQRAPAVEVGDDGSASSGDEWRSFIGEHPELERERLEPTDEELVVALAAAVTERKARKYPDDGAARARCVAWALGGTLDIYAYADVPVELRPSRGDVIRVGQRLGRLAREGRIRLVSKSYEARSYVPSEAVDA